MNAGNNANSSLMELIARELPELNKAFRQVAGFLIASPDSFMRAPIQEIAQVAGVSEPSVVRFCRHFGYKGVPDFRIALAMSMASRSGPDRARFIEPGVSDKAVVNRERKDAIARFASTLIGEDRSIIIDSGSTTEMFARSLRLAHPLVILTTGINIVETLRGATQHHVMLPGGTVRYESNSVSGRLVESTVSSMRFDAAFLGADSIDPAIGLSTFNEEEAHQNAAMIRASHRVIVLADSSKFGAPGLHRICEIGQIHTIVTDTGISTEHKAQIEARGVTVHCVSAESFEI